MIIYDIPMCDVQFFFWKSEKKSLMRVRAKKLMWKTLRTLPQPKRQNQDRETRKSLWWRKLGKKDVPRHEAHPYLGQVISKTYATFNKSNTEYTRVMFSKVKYWSSRTIHLLRSFTGIRWISGKKNRNQHFAAVSQTNQHLAAMGREIQVFYA